MSRHDRPDGPVTPGRPDRWAFPRYRMVEQQLRARGIRDRRLLDAMAEVPRELFVPEHLQSCAYDDRALSIDAGQTISQPYTVAFMLEALRLAGSEKVLEVGTGSGYAAAVLSRLCRQVHTVERIPELAEQATRRLADLGCRNVAVHLADGTLGWPDAAPYGAIVVAAAGTKVPGPLKQQLTDKGTLVLPVGDRTGQEMLRLRRVAGKWIEERLGRFAFVPLIGQHDR